MTDKYQDIDYSLQVLGPHYINENVKKPGYFYCLVGNLPGQIEFYQRLGYQIVQDESIKIGQDKPNSTHAFGSAVTVQSKCGQLLVLMALPNELKAKLDQSTANKIIESNRSMGHIDGIPIKDQIGEVRFTHK